MSTREQKYRQAAFTYLHVGILYEAAVYVAWRQGVIAMGRGAIWGWLLAGALIVGVIFWALWKWQRPWIARAVWALHALRLPALIEGAFFAGAAQRLPAAFYTVALIVVVFNLAMLARAGWDL